jgi:hypothetical protein
MSHERCHLYLVAHNLACRNQTGAAVHVSFRLWPSICNKWERKCVRTVNTFFYEMGMSLVPKRAKNLIV